MEDNEDDTGDNADDGTAHEATPATPDGTGKSNIARRRRFDELRAQGRANRSSMRSLHSMDGALACLMQTTPFALISAVEVTEKADLSRNTFYHHFPTCDALLDEFLSEPTAHVMENMKALAVWMDPNDPRQFATFLVSVVAEDQAMLRERFFVANEGNRRMLTARLLDEVTPIAGRGVGRWTLRGASGELRDRRTAMTLRYVVLAENVTIEVVACRLRDVDGTPTVGGPEDDRRMVELLTSLYAKARDAYLTE